jgi:ABC-type nitrate/sulfonate/bicarbonate transport system permease component
LGLLIGWSRIMSSLFDPMIQGLRPIPITAWLPFSIALFGKYPLVRMACFGRRACIGADATSAAAA